MLEKLNDTFEKLELFDENFGLSINEILRKISSQLGVDYTNGEIAITRNGKEYLMFIYHGEPGCRVGVPSFFEIKSKIPYPHPCFSIKNSDSLTWLAEHILFKTDYKIGDADFDAKFCIKVDEKKWGSQFFANAIVKKGLSELIQQGFDVIHSEDGHIKAVRYSALGGPYQATEMIEKAIEHLDHIISNFPHVYDPNSIDNPSDTDLLNYSLRDMTKDLKEAKYDFIFGDMDEKARKRTGIMIIIVFILAAIAYGRLIAFCLNSPLSP